MKCVIVKRYRGREGYRGDGGVGGDRGLGLAGGEGQAAGLPTGVPALARGLGLGGGAEGAPRGGSGFKAPCQSAELELLRGPHGKR